MRPFKPPGDYLSYPLSPVQLTNFFHDSIRERLSNTFKVKPLLNVSGEVGRVVKLRFKKGILTNFPDSIIDDVYN